MWQALAEGDLEALQSLLQEQPQLVESTYPGDVNQLDLEAQSSFSNTALHFAVAKDQLAIARLLLEQGADVNQPGYDKTKGLTPPLVLAAGYAGPDLLKLLLEHGADPNLPASAETALYTAVEQHEKEKMAILLEHGARHDAFTAAIAGDTKLVQELLEAYPPLLKARSSKRNRTPWEEAAAHDQDEVMAAIRAWTSRNPGPQNSGSTPDFGDLAYKDESGLQWPA